MTSEIVVFTAIFGRRDTLKDPTVVTPGCRYICYSDQPLASRVWEVMRPERRYADPRRESRRFKLRPHHFFDSRHSLWVDASFRINTDVRALIERYLGGTDIALFEHPDRDCVFDEGAICLELRLDDPALIQQQLDRYTRAGLPRHAGLISSGVVLRRHTPTIAELNELWWRELEAGSCRDQLSLSFALWQLGVAATTIEGNIRLNPAIELVDHRPGTTREWVPPSEAPTRLSERVASDDP